LRFLSILVEAVQYIRVAAVAEYIWLVAYGLAAAVQYGPIRERDAL
jgi:hypothetical protein